MHALPLRGDDNLADAVAPSPPATDSNVGATGLSIAGSRIGEPTLRLVRGKTRSPDTPSSCDAADSVANMQLVERIRAGDQAAFAELVLNYTRPLRTFIQGYVRSPHAAEELVQDLFLNVWRMGPDWQPRSNLRAYLYAAARNFALLYCRRASVVERWETAVATSDEAPAMGTPSGPADRYVETSELDAALRHAIAQLPPRCRQVATLRLHHDLSYAEIAEVMGVTVKAVERQATKALRTLRTNLARHLER
jgi:RNA polymerase sigma-70 factor (ECF subfamily)